MSTFTTRDPLYRKAASPVQATSAWIDPSGGFHPVPDCGHHDWAERFEARTVDGPTDDLDFGFIVVQTTESYPTDRMEREGWLHVSFGNVMTERTPSQSALDTLYDTVMAFEASPVEHIVRHGHGLRDAFNRFVA